jgi:small subunit ribosomal protein S16
MSLKIRMSRGGAKKRPFYSIVVAESRSPRDGRFLEKVGTYNPMVTRESGNRVMLKKERIEHWLKMGATPSERVQGFLAEIGLAEKPKQHVQTTKQLPKKKAQERAAAAADAKAKAEGTEAPAQ